MLSYLELSTSEWEDYWSRMKTYRDGIIGVRITFLEWCPEEDLNKNFLTTEDQ